MTDSPERSGVGDPFRIFAIERDGLPENESRSDVDPLPEPVARAVANANRPEDRHSDRFEYVSVSRAEFRAALRPFYGEPLPEMTPDAIYFVRRNGTVHELHFDVVTE